MHFPVHLNGVLRNTLPDRTTLQVLPFLPSQFLALL